MREILFRGKRQDINQWIYGSLIKLEIGTFIVDEKDRCNLLGCGEYDFNFKSIWVKSDTVSEFTGLCDKNGTKIFEGDVVKDNYGKSEKVTYFDGRFCPFNLYPEYKSWNHYDCVVIGNIHDNPELLRYEKMYI